MKCFYLKIFLVTAALIGSAGVGLASCSHKSAKGVHPKHCVNGFVCNQAKSGSDKFRAEAQRRGLKCYKAIVPANSASKNNLTNKKLCQLATMKSQNRTIWNENKFALPHVASAKLRGLKCGVVHISSEAVPTNHLVLSAAKLCLLATKKDKGKIIWNSNSFAEAHIAQAKKRGLNCGTSPDEPEIEIPENYQAGIEAYNSGDFKTAMEQAKLLAPLGNADAQFYLGKMYAEGKGTLQRNTHAHMWFNLASANSHEESGSARDALSEKMTPTAVEKAQELAAACLDSNYQNCGLGNES